jgi:transposase
VIKYTTIQQFNKDFPDDDACLEYIFNQRYGKDYECPKCHKRGFYRNRGRKSYSCAWCGYDISPLAGTIFHKSPTSLKNWFFAIFLMSTSKNGVAAKEIQRQTGVTYKTAWRMMRQIRKLMDSVDSTKLEGTIEVDETYIGGKRQGKRGRGAEGKSIVFGMAEREGEVRAEVVTNAKAKTLINIIRKNVEEKSHIMSDEFQSYEDIAHYGFSHGVV